MGKSKKIIAFILLLSLVATLFSACQSSKGGKQQNNSKMLQNEHGTTTQTGNLTGEYGDETYETDEHGEVIGGRPDRTRPSRTRKTRPQRTTTTKKGGGNAGGNAGGPSENLEESKKLIPAGTKIQIAGLFPAVWSDGGSKESPAVKTARLEFQKVIKEIEQDYRVTINFKLADFGSIIGDIVKTTSGGGTYADIIEIGPAIFYDLVANPSQLLLPYDDNKHIDPNASHWYKPTKEFTRFKGKTYGVSWVSQSRALPLNNVLYFNKRILKEYGYKDTDIYNMVKDKKWTWDKFMEISQDIMNRSGKKYYGLTAFSEQSLASSMIPTNNGILAKEESNKMQFVTNLKDKSYFNNTIEALDFTKRILYEDKIYYAPDEKLGPKGPFMDGKTAFCITGFADAYNYLTSQMKDDYGIIPYPLGKNQKNYFAQVVDGDFFCLLRNTKNPKQNEYASIILNAMSTRTYVKDWKTLERKRSLRDSQSADMMEIMVNNPIIDIAPNCPPFRDQIMPMVFEIITGKRTAKEGLQAVSGKCQATLNELFNR